tara:strand:- start:12338 stop:15340 length:3003 start_codon:yes stop_codon:yes gene_type:complete
MGQNLDQKAKKEIAKFLGFLKSLDGGNYHEVRFLGAKKERRPSGYYNHSNHDLLFHEINRLDAASGSYITINAVKKGIEKRSLGRSARGVSIEDDDIDQISFIFIDIDPERAAGKKKHCSTEEEKKSANKVAYAVIEYLDQQGWPEPACLNDSGNGYHIFYACKFPIGFSHTIQDLLTVLSYKLETADAKIDKSVFNPGRIVRIPGTVNAKGDNTPDRPHRVCKNLVYNESPQRVTAPMVEKIANMLPQIKEFHTPKVINKSSATIDEIEEKSNIRITNKAHPAVSGGDLVYKFACPECDNTDVSGYIRMTDAGFAYKCFHNTCNVSTSKFAKKYGIKMSHESPPKGESDDMLSRVWSGSKYNGQFGLRLPDGYVWEDGGLKVMDGRQVKEITRQPMYFGAILEDIELGTENVQLCWYKRRRWNMRVVAREDLMNRAKLVGLSSMGLGAGSDNATMLTHYFRRFEEQNEGNLKFGTTSRKMGWKTIDEKKGFLLGGRYISEDSESQAADLSSVPAKDWPKNCVSYMPSDAGDKQQAESIRSMGNSAAWADAMSWAVKHPNLLIMILASFSSPLLRVFNQSGFTLDFCNKTSTGKTTGLNFAASVWGNPDTNASGSLIKGWDSTTNSVERVAACRTDLPMFMDDTKTARSPEDVARTVFKLANGHGRGRATITGLAREISFLNITISTGEDPISESAPYGGLDARNLEISGPMFTEESNAFAHEIEENKQQIMENYGWGGPALLSYLLSNKDRWSEWRELRKKIATKLKTRQDNVLNRLAKNMSVVWAGGEIIREAGILDVTEKQIEDAILGIWNVCIENKDRTEMDISALRCATQFLAAWPDQVLIKDVDREGKWDATLADPDGQVGMYTRPGKKIARIDIKKGEVIKISIEGGAFDKHLASHKYVSSQIKKQWRDRGWIDAPKGRLTKPTFLSKHHRPHCVVINKEACELIDIYGDADKQERERLYSQKSQQDHFSDARRRLDLGSVTEEENEETLGYY